MAELLRTSVLRGQHLIQIAVGGYAALISFKAIMRLQKYESTAKKLADWSSEAGKQLQLTRTTQGAGAVALLVSLVSSTTLGLTPGSIPQWVRYGLSPMTLLVIIAARTHMKNYWAPRDGKSAGMRIPLPKMGDYNEATQQTEELLRLLQVLEYSWLAASFFHAVLS